MLHWYENVQPSPSYVFLQLSPGGLLLPSPVYVCRFLWLRMDAALDMITKTMHWIPINHKFGNASACLEQFQWSLHQSRKARFRSLLKEIENYKSLSVHSTKWIEQGTHCTFFVLKKTVKVIGTQTLALATWHLGGGLLLFQVSANFICIPAEPNKT